MAEPNPVSSLPALQGPRTSSSRVLKTTRPAALPSGEPGHINKRPPPGTFLEIKGPVIMSSLMTAGSLQQVREVPLQASLRWLRSAAQLSFTPSRTFLPTKKRNTRSNFSESALKSNTSLSHTSRGLEKRDAVPTRVGARESAITPDYLRGEKCKPASRRRQADVPSGAPGSFQYNKPHSYNYTLFAELLQRLGELRPLLPRHCPS